MKETEMELDEDGFDVIRTYFKCSCGRYVKKDEMVDYEHGDVLSCINCCD